MNFYTYLWLREDGTPYYAGKGVRDRAFVHRERKGVRPPEDLTRILIQEFPSEEAAFEAEKFLIAYYGRKDLGTGCLRNYTNGGEGLSGFRHSENSKKQTSRALLGRVISWRDKVSATVKQRWTEGCFPRKAKRTHCYRGHEFTPDNVYVDAKSQDRLCKICLAAKQRRWKDKRRALAAVA